MNKKEQGKRSLGKISVLIILLLAAAVMLLMFGKGGFGNDMGNGFDENADRSINEDTENEVTDAVEETTQIVTTLMIEEIKFVEVTVSGNEYIYQNSKISIDELIDTLAKLEGDMTVMINDENSSLKAYKELKEKLDDSGISYMENNT